MELPADVVWSTLLFSAKWLFIGLIYAALLVVLVAVRREMSRGLDGAPAPAGRLKVISSGGDPRVRPGIFLALAKITTMGADKANDVVLADPFISGHHARLKWDGSKWWLEDLGSRNGTFINGRKCPPHQAQLVPMGATVALGDMRFELTE